MSKKISQAGLQLIKNFEGCRLTAYKPVPWEKYWTIGWGHYGADVKQGQTITQAQADKMLIDDMGKYESFVNNPAYVPLTAQLNQHQFDALVSFCYNCGQGNLKTLCQKGRTLAQIAAKIPEYNKAGGNVLNGLVRRRKAEVELFNKKVDVPPVKPTPKVELSVIVKGKTIEGAKLIDNTTYVPLRAIVDALGVKLDWDAKTKTASIK
jgi:GH24 family phage-related lysozyme (muramidase)